MQQQHLLLACTPAAGPLLLVPRPRLLLLAVVFATAFFGGAALTPALTGRAAPTNAMTSLEMMRHGNVSVNVGFPRAAFRVEQPGEQVLRMPRMFKGCIRAWDLPKCCRTAHLGGHSGYAVYMLSGYLRG